VDYRGEPVFAATIRLDRAPWGIVVKVDQREALASYRLEIRRTGTTVIAVILGFWAVAFTLVLGWRRRAEAALREGEERYRATLYSIGDAVIATDQGGRVKQMNPVAEKLTGWTESQARGRPLDEVFRIVNEETHAVVESPVARVLREGQVVGLANHSLLIGKDGKQRPIADSGAPIRNEKGETTGVVLVFRDQTQERAAQKALKESEAFNRTIVESIPQQLFLKDRNGAYLAVNQPYAASLGCRPEQLVGKDDFAFYPTELAEKYRADDRAVMDSGQVKDMEERYLAQGKEYWIHTIKAPVRDDGGQVTAVLGLFEDISARQRMEQSLKDARDRLEEAQRAAHLGNWEFDVLNDQITGSQEFYRLFDVAPEDIARFSQFVERLHPDDRERVQRDVADALKQDRPYDTDYRVRLSDGGWRDVIARGRVFVDEGGKPLRMVGTCLDITERKQAEAALRESEERNRTTLNSIGDAVIATGADSRIARMNPVAGKLTGWTEAEALGKPLAAVFRIVNEETRAEVESPVDRVLREGVVVGLANHTVLVAKDGTDRPIADSGAPIRNENGETTGVVLVFRDQTEERAVQRALAEREAQFRATFEQAAVGIAHVRLDGAWLRVNQRLCDIVGYTSDELLHKTFQDITHPDDLGRDINYLQQILAGEIQTYSMEKRYIRKDRSLVWINLTVGPVRDDTGALKYFVSVVEDISARKRAQAELDVSQRRLISMINAITESAFLMEPDGTILIANGAVAERLGTTPADMVGRNVFDFLPSELAPGRRLRIAEVMQTRAAVHFEDCRGERHIWNSIYPVFDSGNAVRQLAVFGYDITERKRAEDEVRTLNAALEQRVRDRTAQLEESNKELEAFSYSVSHDLRAPLRAIDGFTRLLADDYAPHLDTEGKRLCSIIHENTAKMGRLIDDLLAFSRLGRAEMSLSPVDMQTMANSVFHELTTPESLARIDFQVGALPPTLADPTLMRQVWMNLLSNAIKFSSKREQAVIKVSAQQDQGESVYVVQDNGAGFEMQYVGKLFGVFQRLHSSKEFEGTGVGLALVQRVIRRHGGRVWAESELDKGATFYFALQQRGA
jgi:PAS domain S-box-containing protein